MLPGKAGFTEATSLPTTSQTTRCNAGDVLVSNIRPYFKKIVLCQSEGGCSTDVLCFAPKTPAHSAYLFCTLYADRFFDFMVAGSKGTKMPRGDKQQIMTYPIYIPTESDLTAFADFATPILSQIHATTKKMRNWNICVTHCFQSSCPARLMCPVSTSKPLNYRLSYY